MAQNRVPRWAIDQARCQRLNPIGPDGIEAAKFGRSKNHVALKPARSFCFGSCPSDQGAPTMGRRQLAVLLGHGQQIDHRPRSAHETELDQPGEGGPAAFAVHPQFNWRLYPWGLYRKVFSNPTLDDLASLILDSERPVWPEIQTIRAQTHIERSFAEFCDASELRRQPDEQTSEFLPTSARPRDAIPYCQNPCGRPLAASQRLERTDHQFPHQWHPHAEPGSSSADPQEAARTACHDRTARHAFRACFLSRVYCARRPCGRMPAMQLQPGTSVERYTVVRALAL